MYDLIYADKKAEEIIKKQFPNAKTKDASDYIHTERFEITMDGDMPDEYIEFMLRSGLFELSLNIGLALTGINKKAKDRIMGIAGKLKKEKENINA